jgi:hypothetical protein
MLSFSAGRTRCGTGTLKVLLVQSESVGLHSLCRTRAGYGGCVAWPCGWRHLLRGLEDTRCCSSSSGKSSSSSSSKGGSSSGGVKELARSVRAMPIKLISVSKANSRGTSTMAAEWVGKLARYEAAPPGLDLCHSGWRHLPIKLCSASTVHSTTSTGLMLQAARQRTRVRAALLRGLMPPRYTSVSEVSLKPNPLGATSPQVQRDGEAAKVCSAVAAGCVCAVRRQQPQRWG